MPAPCFLSMPAFAGALVISAWACTLACAHAVARTSETGWIRPCVPDEPAHRVAVAELAAIDKALAPRGANDDLGGARSELAR